LAFSNNQGIGQQYYPDTTDDISGPREAIGPWVTGYIDFSNRWSNGSGSQQSFRFFPRISFLIKIILFLKRCSQLLMMKNNGEIHAANRL